MVLGKSFINVYNNEGLTMINKIRPAFFAFAFLSTTNAYPAWSVDFIPNEASSVTVLINNQPFYVWENASGPQNIPLPPQFINTCNIHIRAQANPKGRNATIEFLWDGQNKQSMHFKDAEDHDVRCN